MAKENKYEVVVSKEYKTKVSLVLNKETNKEYVNYVLQVGEYSINLSLRNYDSNINQIVVHDLKVKK